MQKRYVTGLIHCLPLLPILFALLFGCSAQLPLENPQGPKTYKQSVNISFNGFRRTYLVHVPPSYTPDRLHPLVVVVHGAFDTAEGMEKVSGFSLLADRENFIALYPNGVGLFGFLQHWNAGHCCGKAAAEQLDDVEFLAATIEDASNLLRIDRSRIYMVGFSNGGMLVYRFAAEKGNMLAAAAPMAASIGGKATASSPLWRIPEPVRSLPLLVIHGLSDDDIRYEGGVSFHRGGERTFMPVQESINFWVQRNRCNPHPQERTLYGNSVLQKSWTECQENAEIQLYLIKDWGHVWPGSEFTRSLPEGDPRQAFDAAEIVWDFFRSHQRP